MKANKAFRSLGDDDRAEVNVGMVVGAVIGLVIAFILVTGLQKTVDDSAAAAAAGANASNGEKAILGIYGLLFACLPVLGGWFGYRQGS